jgi:hypothetical protein
MKAGPILAGAVIAGGGWYLLTRSGALQGTPLGLDTLGLIPHEPTPAERAQALALRQPAAGNAPIVQNPSFVTSGGLAAVAGLGASFLPLLGLHGVALGITTAGIGLAVLFITYMLLKQRASMHTNDVRDQWEKQFVELHHALGLRALTYDQIRGKGSVAPGTLEMAEVIFNFDHDEKQSLWIAVQHTQNESQFRAAAMNIDRFLAAQGVPVQDVA